MTQGYLFGEPENIPEGDAALALKIYAAYPRKEGKAVALKAIETSLKTFSYDLILACVLAYVKSWEDSEEDFIPDHPHASTYFNQLRWQDFEDEIKAKSDTPAPPTVPREILERAWRTLYGEKAVLPPSFVRLDSGTKEQLIESDPELKELIESRESGVSKSGW